MNELMVHVERIVRPVRAMQSRKLRMRRELLGHLEAALAEERERCDDEATAMTEATRRLGPPAELTAELQKSVPTIERVLLAKVPGIRGFGQWGAGWDHRLFGMDPAMSLGHRTMLVAAATMLPYAAGILVAMRVEPSIYLHAFMQRPLAAMLFNAFNLALMFLLMMVCGHFIGAFSAPPGSGRARRAAASAAAIISLFIPLMLACIAGLAGRDVRASDLVACAIITTMLLLAMAIVGKTIAVRRRPYDAWLTIDTSA